MKNFRKNSKKGFTLVELVVVIAIIAILAAVSVAGYFGITDRARQSAANQEAAQIKTVLSTIVDGEKLTVTDGGKNAENTVVSLEVTISYDATAKVLNIEKDSSIVYNEGVTDATIIFDYYLSVTQDSADKWGENPLKEDGADTADDGKVAKLIYTAANGKTAIINIAA